MEKIKQVFSPGHKKDDAVMYGESTGEGYEHGGANANKDPLHSPSAAEKDTGSKRQLSNPGNDKYDETRFGNTASTDPTAAGTSGNISRVKTDDASTASIRSNVVGSGPTSATNEKISDLGSSSTTAGTTGQGIPDRTSSRHDPNLGRDATSAGGAGAAGIAAREAGQRHHNTNTTSSTLEPRSAGHGTLGHESALGGDSSAYPTGTSGNTGSSHSGRDAALAGGAGAAGVGAYEAERHHDTSSTTGPTSTTGSSGFDPLGSHEHKGHGHMYEGDPCPPGDEAPVSGYPHMTHGPHATDTANRLDPHIPGEFPTATGQDRHGGFGREAATAGGLGATSGLGSSTGTGAAGSGLGSSTGYDGANSGTSRDHHYGRDAGLAGAGAGAAGLAGYEYEKQRAEPSYATGTGPTTGATTGTTGTTGLGSSTGAYDRGTTGTTGLGSSEGAYDPATSGTSRDHHYGRDAGLAGAGAGAAGLAGYEYEKQRAEPSTTTGSSRQPESIGYPSSTSQPSGTTTSTTTTSSTTTSGPHSTQQTGKDHHYGRDAAAAGTAGVAGDEIYNYGRKGPKEEDPASATVGPHKSNVLNVLDPRVLPQPEKMKDQTTEGPHRSDMMNRADPRVDSDLSKQNKDQHHYGRDAAVVGGTGAAGAGAYEYEKNKHQPGYDGTSTTRSQGYADPTSTTSQSKDHHYGRDAALAGGAGAAGVGAYEYGKDRNDPYSTSATQGTTGTTGTTSTAGSQGYADPTQQQHHYGRDAAVAGTGTAAAGGAAYEMDKHEQEKLEKARAKEAEKAQKAHEKDLKHDQKLAEKKHEKEYAAAEKKHEKQYAAAEKEHDKKLTAAEKKHEKELEKQEEKGEKKHHLFGFLHRNKDDTTDDTTTTTTDRPVGRDLETADKEAHLQHQRELEGASAAGTTGVAGVAGAEFEPAADVQERELYGGNMKHETVGEHYGGHSGRNRSHKEPPQEVKEEMQRRSAELSGTGSTPTTAGDRSGAGVGTANY